jgi:hypothetical protein
MKVICILTYERTGSGWLSGIFDTEDSVSVHEIFSDDPLLWFMKCEQIFKKIYNVDPALLKFLSSIYHYNNLFLDTITYDKIKYKILKNNIYNEQILKLFIDICKQHNMNFVFKLFPQHIKYISKDFLHNNTDFMILNYRQDLTKSYYSLEKARVSGIWFKDQTNRQKEEIGIMWDENLYNTYTNNIINNTTILKNIYDNFIKNKYIFSYEEIHENKSLNTYLSKIEYIKNIIQDNNIIFNLNNKEYFSKQNNSINFINQTDFLMSLESSNLKTKLCIQ